MITEVKEELALMSSADFETLEETEQEKEIRTAIRLLKAHYGKRPLSPTTVAFQVLYTLEGRAEHHAYLKRQGVQSASTKGASISFGKDASMIAPEVVSEMGAPSRGAGVGRMI